MNKALKWTAILFSALMLGAVGATIVTQHQYPQNGNVVPTPALTIQCYLEDEVWTNGTAIDWGDICADNTYAYNFTVKNTGNVNATVTMTITGLPSGWTETWLGNNTILQPAETISADLTLYVAVDASEGYVDLGVVVVTATES